MLPPWRPTGTLPLILSLCSVLPAVVAQEVVKINGTDVNGNTRELDVKRRPAIFSGAFADCLNDESLFNVTKFDTAYYQDNTTVLFHMDGSTNIRDESVMLHLIIEIYGETRFNKTFDPCAEGIGSLCPIKAGVPIEAFAVRSIAGDDSASIPSIALNIPDLEGFARLQIFSNSSKTQIGCLQASMKNGQTFSQPSIISSIIGGFTVLAVIASFATAIYGVQIPHMRMHYAHSFSILVLFETLQSIYLSGALSVDWPSMLPAWWSNFAWTVGMIANDRMIHSMASFNGISGNASQVGGAGSVPLNTEGGLTQQIYGRSLASGSVVERAIKSIARRAEFNASDPYDYTWSGSPRNPGLPLPGDFTGFAGTLSVSAIPAKDAFILALIWFIIVLLAAVLFVTVVKLVLDVLAKTKVLKTDGFDYFRSHWLGYIGSGVLRTLFIGFFAMTTLALFQLSIRGPAGPTAIAAIVLIAFIALGGVAGYACYSRLREGKLEIAPDMLRFEQGKLLRVIPFVAITRDSKIGEEEEAEKPRLYGTCRFFRIKFTPDDPNQVRALQDSSYIKKYGWLAARYRPGRWWFFVAYLTYQMVRACFIGGASQNPMAQVYGIFVFEVFAFAAIAKLKPFEGARNTTTAVWLLSISKIITAGLSIALLPTFQLSRVVATIFGMIILVVQAFLAVAVLVLVTIGMVSSWMSLSRNREKFPGILDNWRVQYFEHMAERADLSVPALHDAPEGPNLPSRPASTATFSVRDVRRAPKLGEDNAFPTLADSGMEDPTDRIQAVGRRSRANSANSRYSVSSLPKTGRAHRPSWNSKDFAEWDADMNRGDQARMSHVRSSSLRKQALKYNPNRPMTPTRESAEFQRINSNVLTVEEKEVIARDKIDEDDTKATKRRTVVFADQRTSSIESVSDESTAVPKPSESDDEGKLVDKAEDDSRASTEAEKTSHKSDSKDHGSETEATVMKAEK